MKVKAVITRPDRHNEVVIIKKKRITGNVFRHKDRTYFIDPDRMVITGHRRLKILWRRDFATYYYLQGMSKPLPYPYFGAIVGKKKEGKGKDAKEIETIDFPKVIDNGVSPDELAQIFNPYFYRVISRQEVPWFKDLTFWCAFGALGLSAYIAWKVTGIEGTIKQIKAFIETVAPSFLGE